MICSNSHDRRRRWLFSESPERHALNTAAIPPLAPGPTQPQQAFEALSRDRLMRKLLSNRLWKHALLCLTFCGVPSLITLVLLVTTTPNPLTAWLPPGCLWALTGLELFIAAQLCLLIAAVRSASCIDFHGSYRSWKWLGGFLCMSALLILSHSASNTADLLASLLQPLTGTLHASRPALLLVPAASLLLLILRAVVPDMRHSRWAQSLLLSSALLTLVCVLLSTRLGPSQATLLAAMALTTSGFLLSAVLLQTRFVVHVNPNPPQHGHASAGKATALAPQQLPPDSQPAVCDPVVPTTSVSPPPVSSTPDIPDPQHVETDSSPATQPVTNQTIRADADESTTALDEETIQPPPAISPRRGKTAAKRPRKSA